MLGALLNAALNLRGQEDRNAVLRAQQQAFIESRKSMRQNAISPSMTDEVIETVAIRAMGKVWRMLPPARHHHILNGLSVTYPDMPIVQPEDQGFGTNLRDFVGREEAREIAARKGQLLPTAINHIELFSEDVW